MMYCSDPKQQQYTQVVFNDDETSYLRYCDLIFNPNWNMIGIKWYEMDEGSWDPSMYSEKLENLYKISLQQVVDSGD